MRLARQLLKICQYKKKISGILRASKYTKFNFLFDLDSTDLSYPQ